LAECRAFFLVSLEFQPTCRSVGHTDDGRKGYSPSTTTVPERRQCERRPVLPSPVCPFVASWLQMVLHASPSSVLAAWTETTTTTPTSTSTGSLGVSGKKRNDTENTNLQNRKEKREGERERESGSSRRRWVLEKGRKDRRRRRQRRRLRESLHLIGFQERAISDSILSSTAAQFFISISKRAC
jgi:hypothetical protein